MVGMRRDDGCWLIGAGRNFEKYYLHFTLNVSKLGRLPWTQSVGLSFVLRVVIIALCSHSFEAVRNYQHVDEVY